MRLLYLGTSDEQRSLSDGSTYMEMLRERLEAEIGEPVEYLWKMFWPGPRWNERVDEWLRDFQPDMVYMVCSSYFWAYESVPRRVEQLLGERFGKQAVKVGTKVGEAPVLAHNPGFRAVRRFLNRTVGGAPTFTVEELNDRVGRSLRSIVRSEGTIPIFMTSEGGRAMRASGASKERIRKRTRAIHGTLLPLCDALRIHWELPDGDLLDEETHELAADEFHSAESFYSTRAERETASLKAAWLAR